VESEEEKNLICLASGILMKIDSGHILGERTLMTFNARIKGTIGSAVIKLSGFWWRWMMEDLNQWKYFLR
jgi:hypothetical protein